MSIQQAFTNFISNDFEEAIDMSTIASWSGEHYSIELFTDGTYRILWSTHIGNMYVSRGVILKLPALSPEDWSDDPEERFYENAREYLSCIFAEYQHELTN